MHDHQWMDDMPAGDKGDAVEDIAPTRCGRKTVAHRGDCCSLSARSTATAAVMQGRSSRSRPRHEVATRNHPRAFDDDAHIDDEFRLQPAAAVAAQPAAPSAAAAAAPSHAHSRAQDDVHGQLAALKAENTLLGSIIQQLQLDRQNK